MTSTIIRINTRDLSDEFLRSLKLLFMNKEIEISINEVVDETTYLLSSPANKKHLSNSLKQLKSGETVSFSGKEFDKVTANLIKSASSKSKK